MSSPAELPVDSKYLQACNFQSEEKEIPPFTIVIFGGTGDLSKRKLLPTLYHLHANQEKVREFSIIGIGRQKVDDDAYRKQVREALDTFSEEKVDKDAWSKFARNVRFFSMDVNDDSAYRELIKKIDSVTAKAPDGKKNVIFYMAVPPDMMPIIVSKLTANRLSADAYDAKVLVEKPFGDNQASAKELNAILGRLFNEDRIYRIDHYLAKDTVQNLIFFRFSNAIIEPLWNRRYIDNIQITVAESIGVGHRGSFYEDVGVVRDIVQNHLMQIISLVAMEPPVGFKADYVRDEKIKIFRSIRKMDDAYIDKYTVQGQYGEGIVGGEKVPAYRSEENVSRRSITPTFIAAKLYIDNWRWANVPFYIRTGKRLSERVTKITVQYKQPPLRLLGRTCDTVLPDLLTISIQPEEEISLLMGVKYPHENNMIYRSEMKFNYQGTFKMKPHPEYERLLLDCIQGDQTIFAREDEIEAMWEIVDPIIERWKKHPQQDFPNYAAGTWGPVAANRLLSNEGQHWHNSRDD